MARLREPYPEVPDQLPVKNLASRWATPNVSARMQMLMRAIFLLPRTTPPTYERASPLSSVSRSSTSRASSAARLSANQIVEVDRLVLFNQSRKRQWRAARNDLARLRDRRETIDEGLEDASRVAGKRWPYARRQRQ